MRFLKRLAFILLSILILVTFVYSQTDTPGIPVDSNPDGVAINPQTDIAVTVSPSL